MKDESLHTKLVNIVRAGKPKSIKVNGKNIYISKKKIEEGRELLNKEGGILPLAVLAPLVFGGIGAAGAVAGGAAGIAKAVHDKQYNDALLLEEQKRTQALLNGSTNSSETYTRGRGIKVGAGWKDIKPHVVKFLQAIGLKDEDLKVMKKVFKNMRNVTEIIPTEGAGLHLNPWK